MANRRLKKIVLEVVENQLRDNNPPITRITAQFHQLLDSIRSENEARGFLTDDEINAEIKAYRSEKQVTKA